MKILIWIFTLLAFSYTKAATPPIKKQLNYTLSWDGTSSKVSVDLNYDPGHNDTTVFIYGSEIGGQARIFKVLKNVYSGTNDSLTIIPAKRELIIWHKKKGQSQLHYEIDGQLITDTTNARSNELFRPVVASGSLYVPGFDLFLSTDDSLYNSVTVRWKNYPSGMGYFISSNPIAKPAEEQSISMDKSWYTIMVFNKDLHVRKFEVCKIPYYSVTVRNQSSGNVEAATTPFFVKFFPAVRDFWQDYNGSYYFLSMLPLMNQLSSTATGMNLGDGFSMKYSGNLDQHKKELLAHETSHTWISHNLKFDARGMEYNWFHEGFDDYSAVFNLAKTGLFSKSEFLNYVNNQNLKPHYISSVNTAPADSIGKYFWVNSEYEHLSYQRGFIYAFYLDNQIRLASHNKYTIRDFLLRLYKNHLAAKSEFITVSDFEKAIAPYLPNVDAALQIKNYMLNGQLIDFNKVKLINGFNIRYVQNVPELSIADTVNLQKVFTF